ncbi:MAG: hypothetical protein H0W62_14135 [Chitinophagales bacterium]|nr:hypothetical protein [Chitinophagales bacterium]
MKQAITKITIALVIILTLNYSSLFGQINGSNMPGDSTKTVQAAPTPPAPVTMLTFPVISNICKITLSSYAQARYQYYTDKVTPNNFDIRNARLIFNGTPFRNLAYRLQVDFAPPTVRLMDAYASYTINQFAKLTAGQQKVPLSYESLRTDYDVHSISRSQVVEALTARSKDVIAGSPAVNNNGRDIGFLYSGGLARVSSDPKSNVVEYSLGIFNGNGINKNDADKHKDIAGRVVVYPVKQLSLGGSFYTGKATYGLDLKKPKDRNRFGFDANYNGNRFLLSAEFLQGTDSVTTKNGYYGQAESFIVPKKFAALVKYDHYDPNTDKSDDASTIYSVALNYYFAAFTKIQLQYDFRHENAPTQKNNDLVSVQVQIFF